MTDFDVLNRRCANEGGPATKNQLLTIDESGAIDPVDSDPPRGNTGVELTMGTLPFKPLHMISIWREPGTTTERISFGVVFPSGVGRRSFSVRFVDEGEVLELSVR